MRSRAKPNRRTCQWFFGTAALIVAALLLSVMGSAGASSGNPAVSSQALDGRQMASVAIHLLLKVKCLLSKLPSGLTRSR